MSVRIVFAVSKGEYSDKEVWCLFETRELAEEYIAAYMSTWREANDQPDNTYRRSELYPYEEPYVEELQLWDAVPHASYARTEYDWQGGHVVAYRVNNGVPESDR